MVQRPTKNNSNKNNDDNVVVSVKHLAKTFHLPKEHSSELKQTVINFLKHKRGYTDLHVLRDINFEVHEGDFFGIIGVNGSGKSTLLKLLAGIYQPTRGTVQTEGKIVPFIELGVGFNPELTGRENVYMNGAMLGFSNKEVDAMYDDIVDFAELPEFMDQKLKNYSSGMQVRLAFSIAIKAQGDILILDEVLAVGDEAFQRKCFSYFNDLKRDKKTVILVTHDMSAVERFCNRAIMISKGEIIAEGRPDRVAMRYSRQNDENYLKSINIRQKSEAVAPKEDPYDLTILGEKNAKIHSFIEGDELRVRLDWTQKNVKYAGVALFSEDGQAIYGPNSYQDKAPIINSQSVEYRLKLDIQPGNYYLVSALFGKNDADKIANINEPTTKNSFTINRDSKKPRFVGIARLKSKWVIQ